MLKTGSVKTIEIFAGIVLVALCGVISAGHGLAQSARPKSTLRPLYFILERHQIIPSEMTVDEGTYFIRLGNGIIRDELELQWDDEGGRKIAGKRTRFGSSKSNFLVDLRPGRHSLRVLGYPKLQVEITVKPKK